MCVHDGLSFQHCNSIHGITCGKVIKAAAATPPQYEIEPGRGGGSAVEAPEHRRPQVNSRLPLSDRWQGGPQEGTQFLVFGFVHGSIPTFFSLLRSRWTARNSRDFTALSDMPRALEMSP